MTMNEFNYCKLEIFIPESHLNVLHEALRKAGAGHIGKYDSCISYTHTMGRWRPLEDAAPYIGTVGEVSEEPEVKVEAYCPAEKAEEVLAAAVAVHPYEQPVISVIPLWRTCF